MLENVGLLQSSSFLSSLWEHLGTPLFQPQALFHGDLQSCSLEGV
jgi:hypothetical protein